MAQGVPRHYKLGVDLTVCNTRCACDARVRIQETHITSKEKAL